MSNRRYISEFPDSECKLVILYLLYSLFSNIKVRAPIIDQCLISKTLKLSVAQPGGKKYYYPHHEKGLHTKICSFDAHTNKVYGITCIFDNVQVSDNS